MAARKIAFAMQEGGLYAPWFNDAHKLSPAIVVYADGKVTDRIAKSKGFLREKFTRKEAQRIANVATANGTSHLR